LKNYNLQLTEDNLAKLLLEDPLERTESIVSLANLINQIKSSAIISLDGKWGSGKTFLVKQLELLFDKKEYLKEWQEKYRYKYGDIKVDELNFDDTKIIYYDAWENDGSENPLLNLIYNLVIKSGIKLDEKKIGINLNKVGEFTWNYIKNLNPAFQVIDFIKQFVTIDDSDEKKLLGQIENENSVKEFIKLLVNEIKGEKKLLIIIDELDRCKPEFALRIIESIKHYFDIDNIITLVVFNKKEMCSVINNYYGDGFNANDYLDKIVDFQLHIPEYSKENYLLFKLNKNDPGGIIYNSMLTIINKYDLEMRSINRFLTAVNNFMPEDIIRGKEQITSPFDDDIIRYFMRSYLLIYLIGLKYFDNELYEKMIKGKGVDEFIDDYFLNKTVDSIIKIKTLEKELSQTDLGRMNDIKYILKIIYYKCFTKEIIDGKYKEMTDKIAENLPYVMNTCNFLKLIDKYQY